MFQPRLLSLSLLASMFSSASFATSTSYHADFEPFEPEHQFRVGYADQALDLDEQSLSFQGPEISYRQDRGMASFNLKVLDDNDNDAQLIDFSLSGERRLYQYHGFSLDAGIGLGLTFVDVNDYDEAGRFMSFPFTLSANYQFQSDFLLSAQVGYTYFLSVGDSETTCKDGTTTSSQGSGSCSHHGGVASYGTDGMDDVHGMNFGVMLGYAF